MRPAKGFAVLIIVFLALATTACSLSPPRPQPAQPEQLPPTAPASPGSQERDLSSALLTTNDLPGFSVAEDPTAGQSPEGCSGLEFDPESGATAHAQVLFKQSELGPFVRERLLRFPSGGADALITKVRSAAKTCSSFTTHDQIVGALEFKVTPLDLGSLADATAAIRLTGRPVNFNISIYQDLAAVRQADTVIMISHLATGTIDTELTRATVRKALAKLPK